MTSAAASIMSDFYNLVRSVSSIIALNLIDPESFNYGKLKKGIIAKRDHLRYHRASARNVFRIYFQAI